MYGCDIWTIKKAEHQRTAAFEPWCCRRFSKVPWTVRRSNQSILKEISPEYSLEVLMLKLKLQYLDTWCKELTPCDPVDCSTPGFPVHHQLPKLAQTHISVAMQPSHPLSSPSPPAFSLSQHQGFFSSLHQVDKILELQLQHQSFQWIVRVDFL